MKGVSFLHSRLISVRIQRAHLVKRSRELLSERNALAQESNHSDATRRRIAGITLALRNIQSSIESLTEKEQKDGLAKYASVLCGGKTCPLRFLCLAERIG